MPIRSAQDLVLVRQAVRTWTAELKFSLVEQTKMVTAASELARNTLDYGKGGHVTLQVLQEGLRKGGAVERVDEGGVYGGGEGGEAPARGDAGGLVEEADFDLIGAEAARLDMAVRFFSHRFVQGPCQRCARAVRAFVILQFRERHDVGVKLGEGCDDLGALTGELLGCGRAA